MARPKDPELERLWRLRLLQHSTSGLSITEFCSRAGLPCSSVLLLEAAARRRITPHTPTSAPVRPAPR